MADFLGRAVAVEIGEQLLAESHPEARTNGVAAGDSLRHVLNGLYGTIHERPGLVPPTGDARRHIEAALGHARGSVIGTKDDMRAAAEHLLKLATPAELAQARARYARAGPVWTAIKNAPMPIDAAPPATSPRSLTPPASTGVLASKTPPRSRGPAVALGAAALATAVGVALRHKKKPRRRRRR